MGYRSDVVIGITNEVDIPENVKQQLFNDCSRVEYKKAGGVSKITKEDPYGEEVYDEEIQITYWFFDYVKWYDSYDEVTTVMDFLHALPDEKFYEWGFLRIGEDWSDTEAEGGFSNLGMWVSRSLQIDGAY